MNQTRTNYQQFINDIYTSQKHILGLVTKLSQRMDDLEARLRSIKDDQNLHLSAVKNSLDELKGEIRHQYSEEAEEIDELNDVLAGEIENLNMMSHSIISPSRYATKLNKEQVEEHTTSLYEGQVTDLEALVTPNNNNISANINDTPAQEALIL